MGEGDVYIKGVNAIDTRGYVGVILASLAGGTIGQVLQSQRRRKFQVIYVAGLEKFIPTSIKEVAKEAGRDKIVDCMGIPTGLCPIEADPITEVQAFKLLAGVEAIPIAAGGVGGAEGSIVMLIKGNEAEVTKAMEIARGMKNAQLPEVNLPNCRTCHSPGCYLSAVGSRQRGKQKTGYDASSHYVGKKGGKVS